MSATTEWIEGGAPGISAARLNEPFHVRAAAFDSVNNRINVTIGPGRAAFLGTIVERLVDTIHHIAAPVINTTYHIYVHSNNTFSHNTTGIELTGAVRLGTVRTGAALADAMTRVDVRGQLPGAAARAHADLINNPHAVTAAQIGAVRLSGDTMSGNLTAPNVLWGVGGSRGAALALGFDLNTLITAGWYDVQNAVNGPPVTQGWAQITVARGHSDFWVHQLATDLHSDGMWHRRCSQVAGPARSWTPWQRIWHEGNFAHMPIPYVQNHTVLTTTGTVETTRKSFRMGKHAANGINVRSISLVAEIWIAGVPSTGRLRLWRVGDAGPLFSVQTTNEMPTLVTVAPIDVSAWPDGIYNFEVRLWNSDSTGVTHNGFLGIYVR